MSEQLILKCKEVLTELKMFSDEILFLGDPINDDRIIKFESELGFNLPSDFKYILKCHNSLSVAGCEVLGIGEQFRGSSIDNVYIFEHNDVGNPMPKALLPFSPDGFGNHYCFDLSKLDNDICPVVFWQHDFAYSKKGELEICYSDFLEWLKEELIEWALQDKNYDGSEK